MYVAETWSRSLRILLISLSLSLFREASDVCASSQLPYVRTFRSVDTHLEIRSFLCGLFTVVLACVGLFVCLATFCCGQGGNYHRVIFVCVCVCVCSHLLSS